MLFISFPFQQIVIFFKHAEVLCIFISNGAKKFSTLGFSLYRLYGLNILHFLSRNTQVALSYLDQGSIRKDSLLSFGIRLIINYSHEV